MPSLHIYFSDEIYEKIRQEPNRSQLVKDLLEEHYLGNKSPDELKSELLEVKEKYDNLKKEIKDLENKTKQEVINKKKEDKEKATLSSFFSDWGSNKNKQKEYLDGLKNGKWRSTIEYAKAKIL